MMDSDSAMNRNGSLRFNFPGPVVVTGATGQLGRAMLELLGDRGHALGRGDCDLEDPANCVRAFEKIHPAAVINTAAYTAVDAAEEHVALCRRINTDAPAEMARWCKAAGIPFVHFSTDYVFPGTGNHFQAEDDPTGPSNEYGLSKLAGERLILQDAGKSLIFRTSWLYDREGKNFLNTMLRLFREREVVSVVSDQVGAPTYVPELAQSVLSCLEQALSLPAFPSGVYQLCHSGATSWHGFALAIRDHAIELGLDLKIREIKSILSSEYPSKASRPHNSRLSNEKVHAIFGVSLPSWQQGLEKCMETFK